MPNKTSFVGVLGQVDVPSDKPPAGSRGHKVLLTKEAAEKALHSLIGVGVNYDLALSSHNPQRKVGVITAADIADGEIHVQGHLWCRDFPEVIHLLQAQADEIGLSWEVADAQVQDTRSKVWTLSRVEFIGVSFLKRASAAYTNTSIRLTGE